MVIFYCMILSLTPLSLDYDSNSSKSYVSESFITLDIILGTFSESPIVILSKTSSE